MPQFGRWPSVTPAGGPPSSAATTLSRARMWPIRCSESPSAIYHGVSIFQPTIAIYARPVAEWDRYTAQNRRACDYRFGGALLEARRLPGRFLLIARRD
jgi:hypothetical protein